MYDKLFESLLELQMPGSYYGVSEAGWLHPNGKFEILPDYHAGDHDKDAFEKLNPGHDWENNDDIISAYKEYLKQGHIRYIQSNRGFNIELIVKPTVSQMKAIRNGMEDSVAGDFYFSIRTRTSYKSDGSSFREFSEEVRKMNKSVPD